MLWMDVYRIVYVPVIDRAIGISDEIEVEAIAVDELKIV